MSDTSTNIRADDNTDEGLRALGGAVRVGIRMLIAVACLMLVVSLFQCYVIVKQHQMGVVYRFGNPSRILKPGQHAFALPSPLEEYRAYTVTRERTVQSKAFEYAVSAAEAETGARTPLPPTLRPGVDGYLLTGDQNIIHCAATLHYRVSDPIAFYERHADGPAVLKALLNNAILRATAALTTERALFNLVSFSEHVTSLLKKDVEATGIGATVSRIVLKTAPPRQAKAAFDAHVAASQEADRLKKQAQGYRARVLSESESGADRVLAVAESEKTRLIRKAKARAAAFLQMLTQYRSNPNVVRRELYIQTLRRVADHADETYIVEERNGRQIRVLLGKTQKSKKKRKADDPTSSNE